MADTSINLLISKAKESEQRVIFVGNLKHMSLLSLVVFLLAGVVIASVFIYVKVQNTNLTGERDRLSSEIKKASVSEGLLASLHDRVQTVGKILSSQVQWGQVLFRLSEIAPSPNLSAIAVDEKHHVIVNVKTKAIEDMFPILAALVSDVESKHFVLSEIVSFQLDKDGSANIAVSFFPSLSP